MISNISHRSFLIFAACSLLLVYDFSLNQSKMCFGQHLQIDRYLDWIKFKQLADNKVNFYKTVVSDFDRVESIVCKGENAGYQHFLLFPQCFQKPCFSGSFNSLPNYKILDQSKLKAFAGDKDDPHDKIYSG